MSLKGKPQITPSSNSFNFEKPLLRDEEQGTNMAAELIWTDRSRHCLLVFATLTLSTDRQIQMLVCATLTPSTDQKISTQVVCANDTLHRPTNPDTAGVCHFDTFTD
ncbi:hypothetical protein PoB_002464300 [Plakobranchus ocellatus]|uniref:Uncharacterized protein n=1 Tax=Plakobranchus ocellatus TaxID=259542 RepID=A0AAV3ZUN1_9GAST|nr:hypothetical protein PoB_002464300 [Plakobranchus ocellatus]